MIDFTLSNSPHFVILSTCPELVEGSAASARREWMLSILYRPACPPKTKLVQLSAGGPAHWPLKYEMYPGRQAGRIHSQMSLR